MDLFLHILLYIGLLLLGILVLCLFLIFLILFVPIFYKGNFKYENGTDIYGIIKGGWLFNLISFSLKYKDNPAFRTKVFGFTVNKKKKEEAFDDFVPDYEGEIKREENSLSKEEKEDIKTEDSASDNVFIKENNTNNEKDNLKKEKDEKKESSNEGLITKIMKYIEIIKSETFKKAFSKNKTKIAKFLKRILPRKLKIEGSVGFEDPSVTGSVLAVTGMLYPLIGKYIRITGNFEKEEILVKGNMKGRITIFSLIFTGLQIYLNKDIKKVIKMLGEA